MTYEPNTWVNFDGYVSLVIGVWPGYYEPFDAEVVDGKIRCGERRYRQIVLRDLFDNPGVAKEIQLDLRRMLINRKHRKRQKPPCHRWRVEVGNVVVWTRNVQYGERHHRQWDSEALFFEALRLGDDEPERQVELLTQAIALTPRDFDCYNNRGIARDALGDAEGALADYEQAIRLNPKRAEAWNNRGYLRYKQQRYAEAIADFDRAIELDPEYANPRVSRGAAYGMLGQHDRAMEDFRQAIEIAPDFLMAYVNRAAYNINLGQLDEARKDLLWVLEQEPDDYTRSYVDQYLQMLDQQQEPEE